MDGFLNQVAAELYERYGEGVASLHVMFPSRRASLFFGDALSKIIRRPIWQPASITIDEVAAELSGLAVGDRLRLVTELYKIYREFHPQESFDTFYFWGEMLLGDFDSIDKYLVDAEVLFSNLVDLRELDTLFEMEPEQRAAIEKFWGSFSLTSPEQRDFLAVWRTLGPVYHRFRARLRELGTAYQGMVYREAAERIVAGSAPQIPDRHYVVAGFNALSRSEQTVFDHLRREAKVDFHWDYDDYFVGDIRQEAGGFMRDNLRRFPPASPLPGGYNNFRKPKKIRSVAAASDVLQCKYAGTAMTDIARQTGLAPGKETAVVLCDESLLPPLLWSMPPEVESINVTMGYPLRMHPAYTFVERLAELQNRRRERRERRNGSRSGTPSFYHSDVEGLVRHPYLQLPDAPDLPPGNFVYIGAARLRTTPLFEKIFSSPAGDDSGSEWRALSNYLIEVISEVARLPFGRDADTGDNESCDRNGGETSDKTNNKTVDRNDESMRRAEFFAVIVEHIRRLANSLEGCGLELSAKTYTRLLRRSLQSVTVPFEGEPLEGVQVMGILETRALDFENIVFLSAGDDNMPGSLTGAPSFIPHNLKAAYGLPTPEHHEGVYAYHFFRLITRARRIGAVWSRTSDDRAPGAPSRYILQLDYESPHEVEKGSVTVDVNLSPVEPIVVEKGAEVMEKLNEFTRDDDPRRLSPSLLFTYAECPLKFYFRGVARLRAEDEVTDQVDGALFGNILHNAMQRLYSPLVGVRDPRERIHALIGSEEVERAATAAVTELFPGEEGSRPEDWGGGTLLAHKTIVDYINRGILPFDAGLPERFVIESLEHPVEGAISFSVNGAGEQRLLLHGIADRIDTLADGSLRVVDYKTGSPKNNASALLQMGLYATMLSGSGSKGGKGNEGNEAVGRSGSKGDKGEGGNETVSGDRKVEPALYYVRDMSKPGYSPPPVEQGEEFEEGLRAMLAELFDPAVPFTQCPDPKPCEWCDFAPVCRR